MRDKRQLLQPHLHEARNAPGESKATLRGLWYPDEHDEHHRHHHDHHYRNHPPILQRDQRKFPVSLYKRRTLFCLHMHYVPHDLRRRPIAMRGWSLPHQRRTGRLLDGPLL